MQNLIPHLMEMSWEINLPQQYFQSVSGARKQHDDLLAIFPITLCDTQGFPTQQMQAQLSQESGR